MLFLRSLLLCMLFALSINAFAGSKPASSASSWQIPDTGVVTFYSDRSVIREPKKGDRFFGQDAQYQQHSPGYKDNGDGTVTDLVTGLMWQKDMGEKLTYAEVFKKARSCRTGGYDDWRVPTIKELYSLILFTGRMIPGRITPFIDTRYFNQPFGDVARGERDIDAQTWSATKYKGTTIHNEESVFGVNFIDGRIKGYPLSHPRDRRPNKLFVRLVRGQTGYGTNHFVDNGDGTITDTATGLMWQKDDSQKGMDWGDALAYAEKLKLAGHDDWRLPNAKELQSIVDYTRSPQVTRTAAIDPVFMISSIKDPQGKKDYPFFWSGTTHLEGRNPFDHAVYVAFGSAQGKMHGRLQDVHGAGAQRSDPKSGRASDYPQYFGPQGDIRYVFNYVRCVRNVDSTK